MFDVITHNQRGIRMKYGKDTFSFITGGFNDCHYKIVKLIVLMTDTY